MSRSAVPLRSFRFPLNGPILATWMILAAAAGAWITYRITRGPDVVVHDERRDNGDKPWTHRIVAQHHVEDFGQPVAQFETVFWEPRDTESLRQMIRETTLVRDKTVLEIGTGSGLIALCCLRAGARKVVATDVNPAAIANARYNASAHGVEDRLETRLVPLDRTGAFSVINESERFDLIISNPPWENRRPTNIANYALYDDGFSLLDSLLSGMKRHLKPGGSALLAYGCVDAIQQTQVIANRIGLSVILKDDRRLEDLPPVFLPGMLLEVR